MDGLIVLMILAAVIPAGASLSLWLGDAGIAERHHSHHDTYVIAGTLTWSLAFAMIVMGSLGILLGWLCVIGAFNANGMVVMSFFDAFLVVSFVYWVFLRRYKVVTYDGYMEVTPFFGPMTSIAYSDISAMEWAVSLIVPNGRNVRVYVDNRRKALLWAGLDLDQILIRIDRYDALDDLAINR